MYVQFTPCVYGVMIKPIYFHKTVHTARREKINLNFYIRWSLWCLKRIYEDHKDLHKTFWGTTKKCQNKLIFIWIQLSEMDGSERANTFEMISVKCDALRDMIPFVQFKKCGKYPLRSATLGKVAGWSSLLKATLLNGWFSRFLNCANGTKSRNASQISFVLRNILLDLRFPVF